MVETQIKKEQISTQGSSDMVAQLKSKFQSMFNKTSSDSSMSSRLTKAFVMTRQTGYVYLSIAIVALACACWYGYSVYQQYDKINQNIEPLRQLETYSLSPNSSVDIYTEGNHKSTVEGMVAISDNIKDVLASRKALKETQEDYYKVFLQNVYLPSLNIWKDPYTKAFDMSVLGQKYLETDKFQNLYLLQYWSDFIKYVGNDVDYNVIDSIEIGNMVEVNGENYFYVPIRVSFTSPNKRAFLLLVNKLSTTSNVNNIALLNEFFFYLIANIKENKPEEISALMQEYWTDFYSSDKWDGFGDAKTLEELTPEQKSKYQDKVIGLYLYKMINDSSFSSDYNLIDDEVLVNTIKQNVSCDETISDVECFYNFRDKYRSLPYLAYGIGLSRQAYRTESFVDFLQDLPSIISITSFGFEKSSSASFLSTTNNSYEGTLSFNAYGRGISQEELDEASMELGKLCFGKTSNISMTVDTALSRINDNISSLGNLDSSTNITDLEELQMVITEIQKSYKGMSNYQKMIKLFELWRMLNDANLCTI